MSFSGHRVSFLLWMLFLLSTNVTVASVAEVSPAAGASTQAEVHIEGRTIRLRLEIGQEEFDRLDEMAKAQQQELQSLLAKIVQIEVDGKNLKLDISQYLGSQAARLLVPDGVEASAMWTDSLASRTGLTTSGSGKQAIQPLMRHAVETTFSIPDDSADPPRLKLTPLLAVGLIVYHEQIPVTEHRLLSQAEILVLDEQDPWFSRFENPAMNRMLQSVITGVLYVEPTEVRQEVIIRLNDLLAWLALSETAEAKMVATAAVENQRFVPPHRQNTLKEQIVTLLMTHNVLSIESKPQRTILDRIEYLTPGPHGLVPADPATQTGQMDIQTTFLGIVFTYITSRYPSEIKLHWSIFPPGVKIIPVTAFDLTGQFDTYVTPSNALFEWTDMIDEYDFLENQVALKEARNASLDTVQVLTTDGRRAPDGLVTGLIVVVLGLGIIFLMGLRRKKQISSGLTLSSGIALLLLAGILVLDVRGYWYAGETPEERLDEAHARQIVAQLLKNVYRSFDFREEHDVYDKLASSVHGKLLETLYLQNRQTQLRAQAGGARTKVQHVEITDTQVAMINSGSPVYHIDTHWMIQGSVAHWGHVHQRQNRYQARLAIEPIDGLWKLTQFELIDEQRIDQQRALP